MCHRGQLASTWLVDEANHSEVGAVHPEEQSGVRPDRLAVVGCIGAIRCSNLDESRATLPQDVRYSEAPANLDQLAA